MGLLPVWLELTKQLPTWPHHPRSCRLPQGTVFHTRKQPKEHSFRWGAGGSGALPGVVSCVGAGRRADAQRTALAAALP